MLSENQKALLAYIKEIKAQPPVPQVYSNEEIFKRLIECIIDLNIKVGFQNRNSKKHGHLKKKINLRTNEVTYEIKIEREEILIGKIYTLLHELTHYISEHLDTKFLSAKQCEVVADTVAILTMQKLGNYDQLKLAMVNKKWDAETYSELYIKNMVISKQRMLVLKKQIDEGVSYMCDILKIEY